MLLSKRCDLLLPMHGPPIDALQELRTEPSELGPLLEKVAPIHCRSLSVSRGNSRLADGGRVRPLRALHVTALLHVACPLHVACRWPVATRSSMSSLTS